MPNDTLVGIKDLSQAEILVKIRSNEIEVPKKGQERDEFMKFVAAAPGSEERSGILGNEPPPPEEGTPPDGGTPPPKENEPGKTEIPDGTPPKGDAPPQEKPPEGSSSDDFLGYGSKEAMEESHRKLLSDVGELRKHVDKLNESGGKLGRRNKDLEAQIQEIHKQVKSGKAPAAPTDSGIIDEDIGAPPTAPKSEDFEGGMFDDDYQVALNKHIVEMGGYMAKQSQLNSKLQAQLADVSKKADSAFTVVDGQSKASKEKAWDSFWGHIRDHIKSSGMKTTVDIAEINAAVLRKDTEYISRLPKADMETFNRITPVANSFADFTKGYPELRYDSVADLVKEQQNLWGVPQGGSQPPKRPSPADSQELHDKVKRDQDESVSVPRSGVQGQPPKDITSQSNEEATTRLRELTKMRAANVTRFDNNKELADEFAALRHKFGIGARKR